MKKILIIGNIWPQQKHAVRAANVVIYELLIALAKLKIYKIGYLRIRRLEDPKLTHEGRAGIASLRVNGVDVLNEVSLEGDFRKRNILKKVLAPKNQDFYPEVAQAHKIEEGISSFQPDLILLPWSEWLTAVCADFPFKKIAYYGNPDHKAGKWRFEFDRRYGLTHRSSLRSFIGLKYLEWQHLKNMKKYDLLTDVAMNDVDYYRDKGLANVHYVRNIWIDRYGTEYINLRLIALDQPKNRPLKIVANVGQLQATGNRYGLELVGKEIAPRIRSMMRGVDYEINILGNGQLPSCLQVYFDYPEIKIRGFVDDIDGEILDSEVFLCMNNASPFQVCHTRYLHAWSLGACVIGHANASKSIPEMQTGSNCLLGETNDEVAEHICNALRSAPLRKEIGKNGYKTFSEYFVATKVAGDLARYINAL